MTNKDKKGTLKGSNPRDKKIPKKNDIAKKYFWD